MMRFGGWFKRHATPEDPRLRRWRESWARAESSAAPADIAHLTSELERFGLPEEEIEIEREMLQALLDREELASTTRTSGLPRVETGHRVARGEPCHYSAPASLVEESGQPTGRMLLTAGRAIFVGGGTSVAVPWHAVSTVVHTDRDIILVKNGRETAYRFRCNTYSDALCATYTANEILASRRPSRPGL